RTSRPTSRPPPMRMTFISVELPEKQLCRGSLLQLQRRPPSGCIGGNGSQQRGQFLGCARIEPGIGPLAHACELAKRAFRRRIAPLVENEDRAAKPAESSRLLLPPLYALRPGVAALGHRPPLRPRRHGP